MCTNKKADFSSSAVVPTMSTAKKLAFAATNWGHPNCAIRWRQIWATFQKDKRQKWTLQNPFIPDWTFFSHLPKIPIVHPPTRGLRLKVIPDWDESGVLIVGTATDELKSAFSTVLMVGTAADELKMHGASPLPWG